MSQFSISGMSCDRAQPRTRTPNLSTYFVNAAVLFTMDWRMLGNHKLDPSPIELTSPNRPARDRANP